MFARGIPRTLNKIAIRGYGYVCPRDTKNHKQDSHKRLWLFARGIQRTINKIAIRGYGCLPEGYQEPQTR
jgi:hypothetical protein